MPRPQPSPAPQQLSRAHISRALDRAYNDALVHHLTRGCDLIAARKLAMDAKLQALDAITSEEQQSSCH